VVYWKVGVEERAGADVVVRATRNQANRQGIEGRKTMKATIGMVMATTYLCLAWEAAAGEAGESEERSKWETSAGLGATYSGGNTENLLLTGNIGTQRKWERNEVQLGVTGGYGESRVEVEDPVTGEVSRRTDKNTEFLRGFGQYNRLITERLYGYARADALHDDIANVVYRVTLSPGVGYYFVKNPRTTLSGELGPGYVFERTYNQDTGENENDDYVTLRISEKFEHKLSERARVWQFAELLPQADDLNNYILNVEVGVEADLTESLSLRLVAQDSYDNEPPPGRKKNDFKLIAGVQYTF
jgi:putative salt-induced outer membrane protein